MQDNELYHYGIPGMRWGVRKFQSSNGKYTSTGRKKYIDSKTKNITDKNARLKATKKAGAKYDKVADKTNKRLADNDRRVKEYGAGSVKFANKAHMAVYAMTGASIARSIIKDGASKLRVMKNTPGVAQGEIKAKAALTLIGAGAVIGTTAYINSKLRQDIIDTNNYSKRQSAKKKKKK